MAIIRIALDVEVADAASDAVKDKIFEDREAILNFVRATVIPETDVKVGDTEALGGNTHVHTTFDGPCQACRNYANKQVLTPVR